MYLVHKKLTYGSIKQPEHFSIKTMSYKLVTLDYLCFYLPVFSFPLVVVPVVGVGQGAGLSYLL